MRTITLASIAVSVAAIVMIACGEAPNERAPEAEASQQPSAQTTTIVERDWALVMLGDSAAPLGAGGKPATIRFDSAAKRAAGFAGCNQYSATYTMAGDSLHFGPAISTKMACAEGDSLERAFLSIVPEVSNYQATDSTLTLAGSSGPLARFRAQ
jgi:heat shock protein HslJ